MTPQPKRATKAARGAAIDWTDGDIDRLSEIHSEEDTPLMLAFVRQWGSRRLLDIITSRQEADGDATTGE